MNIDFSKMLKTLEGKVIKDGETDLTLGMACKKALTVDFKGDTADGHEKYKRYKIAGKVMNAGIIDIKAEDIVVIKKCAGHVLFTEVMGAVYDALEGEVVKKEPTKKN